MNLPIGVKGYICNEGVSEPYVIIQDDLTKTGGYLIFRSNSPDFDGSVVRDSNGIVVFDDWVLEDGLEGYFQDKQVDWIEETARVSGH